MDKPNDLQMEIIFDAISDAVKFALDSLGDGWTELSFVNDVENDQLEEKAAA